MVEFMLFDKEVDESSEDVLEISARVELADHLRKVEGGGFDVCLRECQQH